MTSLMNKAAVKQRHNYGQNKMVMVSWDEEKLLRVII